MKIYKKAILPLGFKACGLPCGLKKSGKLDLALFYSQYPAKAACLFTANKVVAAPILLDRINLKKTNAWQAIIVNSGNANCFTGDKGFKDAKDTAGYLAKILKIKEKSILVASTGIIGQRLDLEKIKSGIPDLVKKLSARGIDQAKKAIMTTDTFAKEITVKLKIGARPVSICGVAKGAGMIAPNMATMLVFILTDANISKDALNKAVKAAADKTFNCITVDGCMSTNDSVMVLANGASRNPIISGGNNFAIFSEALELVSLELAKMVVQDAEGATKFIKITLDKARSFKEAKIAALAVANSNLFKTAMFGENPNFGRIVAAIGSTGIYMREEELRIKVSALKKKNIEVKVSLNCGNSAATVYTSDLTPQYIKINAAYN
jgi:glutamate N-acetyltransferase/amino-acid N-acetyltransferase